MRLRDRLRPAAPAALAAVGVLNRQYAARPPDWQFTSALSVLLAIFGGIAVWYLLQLWLARRRAARDGD